MTFIFLVYALVIVYSLRITNLGRLLNSEVSRIPTVKLIYSYESPKLSLAQTKSRYSNGASANAGKAAVSSGSNLKIMSAICLMIFAFTI